MNEIIITQETMSSLQIAELTGKQHAHVMRDIRNMIESLNVGESRCGFTEQNGSEYHRWDRTQYNFLSDNTQKKILDFAFDNTSKSNGNFVVEQDTYMDQQGKDRPFYKLNKKACLLLASGYSISLRAKIIDRWEQLEIESRQRNLPSYQLTDPIQRAQKWIEEEQQRAQLALEVKAKDQIIAQQQPKVLFADCITSSTSNILIADLAKLLTQNGITIGQNRLFDWLTTNGYLIRKQRWSNSKNTYKNEYRPTQRSVELGILSMSEHAIPNPRTGEHFTKFTCYVTGKGQQYFINKFKTATHILAI